MSDDAELVRWRTRDDNPVYLLTAAHGAQRVDVCGECGAVVPWDLRPLHEQFHDDLAYIEETPEPVWSPPPPPAIMDAENSEQPRLQ